MMYVLAVLFPPIAVIIKGTPGQFAVNILLSALFYIPGIIHAIMVVNKVKKEEAEEGV